MRTLSPAIGKFKHCLVSLLVLLLTPGLLFAAQLVGDKSPKLQGEALINALKQGGYIIYFRHGKTVKKGEKKVAAKDMGNCAIQRNLSKEGQAQTKAIGSAFNQHQIPVGKIYSSPYCRCLDTAKNIFGKAEKSDALHFALHLSKSKRGESTKQLRQMFATPPKAGTNTAIVSHTGNLKEAVNIWPKKEGEAHIFKPEGGDKFSYVGMMAPDAWVR